MRICIEDLPKLWPHFGRAADSNFPMAPHLTLMPDPRVRGGGGFGGEVKGGGGGLIDRMEEHLITAPTRFLIICTVM